MNQNEKSDWIFFSLFRVHYVACAATPAAGEILQRGRNESNKSWLIGIARSTCRFIWFHSSYTDTSGSIIFLYYYC